MVNHGTGWVRIEYLVPARGLIGFRTEFLTETRGSGHPALGLRALRAVARRDQDAPDRIAGGRPPRGDRPFALVKLQERGQLFVGPGEEVYEGMVVGENARADDLDVNAVREKKQTNIRAAGVRRHGAARAAPPALARPGARVHPPRRVRGGHAREAAPAKGRAPRGRAAEARARGEAGLVTRRCGGASPLRPRPRTGRGSARAACGRGNATWGSGARCRGPWSCRCGTPARRRARTRSAP